MVRVEFLGPINKEPVELNVVNLEELAAILSQDEDLRKWLSQCAVAVNDEIVKDINFKLKDGDRVSLLPPVCGG